MKSLNPKLKLLFLIILCELAGGIGSIFTSPAIPRWYATILKPSFNPPNWIFAPVWTLLFLLMGISLYLIIKNGLKDKEVKRGLIIFVFQFALNIIWSFIFFSLHNPFYAFLEIIVLWLAISGTIIQFEKIDRKAAYLLLPYLIWVSFAAILNCAIWNLNA